MVKLAPSTTLWSDLNEEVRWNRDLCMLEVIRSGEVLYQMTPEFLIEDFHPKDRSGAD